GRRNRGMTPMSAAIDLAPPDAANAPIAAQALDERICRFLVERGRLKEADLARGRRLHAEDAGGTRLISLLTRLGLVSERDMAEAMSELLDLPLLAARDFPD